MIRRPPRSTQSRSSAASDVYKRQGPDARFLHNVFGAFFAQDLIDFFESLGVKNVVEQLSLIHISEPTRPY